MSCDCLYPSDAIIQKRGNVNRLYFIGHHFRSLLVSHGIKMKQKIKKRITTVGVIAVIFVGAVIYKYWDIFLYRFQADSTGGSGRTLLYTTIWQRWIDSDLIIFYLALFL